MKIIRLIESILLISLLLSTFARKKRKNGMKGIADLEKLISNKDTDCSNYFKIFNADLIISIVPAAKERVLKSCQLNCQNLDYEKYLPQVIKYMHQNKKLDAKTFLDLMFEKTWSLKNCF